MTDLASHYSRFRVGERLLLTGHSHQAWPDVGFEAQQRAWLDAAEYVDLKWERAAEQARRVRVGFAALLEVGPEQIALGQNTHELVTRWLSALPLRARPRLVTTDGEFHTIRRQIDRLAEEALEVVKVAAGPGETLAERLECAVDDRTAGVLVSSVLYETAEIVPGLDRLAHTCERTGAGLLVDAYHHLNVVPFDVAAAGLDTAFITGGGYKYCQLGEGNCLLRVPAGARLRPALTGWFAEFEALEHRADGRVEYGPGAAAFAGATYDPTSHYRAAAVFAFHAEHRLTPPRLREISRRQVSRLKAAVERLDLNPAVARVEPMSEDRRAGFLAVRMPGATRVAQALRDRGVFVDARGDVLRLGPAPYLRDDQLDSAVAVLGEQLNAAQGR
jgi:kynureninase